MPFQAIKTRRSKSRKIDIFPKGLTRGIGKKYPFFNFFFLGNIGKENVFYAILLREKAYLRYKNNKFKKSKNRYFSKRVNPWFWSKKGHISNIFFQAIQPRKMSFTIFQNEKKPFKAIKTRSLKFQKTDIFPNGLTNRFSPKIAFFFKLFFFQAIQARKISITIFYNENTPFQAIKTRSSKSRKLDIFLKVFLAYIAMVLVQKWPFFQIFFLDIIGQENVFYDILERKNAFLGFKNKKLKKSKN